MLFIVLDQSKNRPDNLLVSALEVHIMLPFIFNGGEGAGGIRRVAPVVYDDFIRNFFHFLCPPPPLVTQINGDDPPPPQENKKGKKNKESGNKEKKNEKSVSLSLSLNETLGSPEACFLGKI